MSLSFLTLAPFALNPKHETLDLYPQQKPLQNTKSILTTLSQTARSQFQPSVVCLPPIPLILPPVLWLTLEPLLLKPQTLGTLCLDTIIQNP
jgi:hypothetical protein